MLLAINFATVGKVLLVLMIILLILMLVLYFMGRKMQAKQAEQQPVIEANTQLVSMLVIDKKKMKIKEAVEAGLPSMVLEQTPFYLKRAKLPIVKAKIGPRVMTLVSDASAFEIIPVRSECRCTVSGMYIREVKSVRGGKLPEKKVKKGFIARLKAKAGM